MPKKFKTIDGNTAATHVAYAFSEVAAIYPITPSTPMGEMSDAWAAHNVKNVFGETVKVAELQSEGGASGAVHGSLSGGSLTTTFTASQGLLLMIPNMHKIAGELLPTVFHVAARSLATQALSIFGDHTDVMSVRNTGFALMSASSIQEIHDLAIVSHLATLKSKVPFLNFFDGFRNSHEIKKVELLDYDDLKNLVEMKYVEEFRKNALNPNNPRLKVGAENPDVYFQGREVSNKFYNETPAIVQEYMDKVSSVLGRSYHLFDYVGHPKATDIIIAMGSGNDTIEETVNYLNSKGKKVGLIKVRLYRPFSVDAFINAIPKSVKRIAVLDRTKEPGSVGEPLYLDVAASLKDSKIKVIGGRYGLSSKEFTPTMVKSVYDHLAGKATHNFTVGINDDVTHLSLPLDKKINAEPDGVISCKFWGYGSDGTVGANKNSIKIIGDNTDNYAQGYFVYDSKKSGGITISHLRFGKQLIQSEYLLESVDFVALHKTSYIGKYDILENVKEGATFLINSEWSTNEVFSHLTEDMQKTIIEKKLKVYNINAVKIAKEVGLGGRISTVMQTAFFKLANIMDTEKAIQLIKDAIKKTFSKKGDDIVQMNWNAVDKAIAGIEEVVVPATIEKSAPVPQLIPENADEFTKKVIDPIMHGKGNEIPVSAMPLDGGVPTGTCAIEKRGVAIEVPRWTPDNCIQCNFCSLVCPHGAIRPKQIDPENLEGAPETFKTIDASTNRVTKKERKFKIQVYVEDCVGCGSCANTCPGNKNGKALVMVPIQEERDNGENKNLEFFEKLPYETDGANLNTVGGTQFLQPYFEFSGACAGCGETPYIKLATQLFGDRMIIANATGCSSIYGGTFPTVPYTKDKNGKGPAWANSLFEDNAEYGYGMRLSVDSIREQLLTNTKSLLEKGTSDELKPLLEKAVELWDSVDEEAKANAEAIKQILPKALANASEEIKPIVKKIIELQDYFVNKSVWSIGGDGWAYDIGYGGLDHVLTSGRNINVLVLDTEVYSNTGGQASKATSMGARAKFAEAGKKLPKKDLGLIAMSYGYVYVAALSMGANMNQVVKAFKEAESYNGPSLLVAYSPCIAHGVDMSKPQEAMKRATQSGHWPLYRFDPRLKKEGKNPMQLDGKDIKIPLADYMSQEIRYRSLKTLYPEKADELYEKAQKTTTAHFEYLKKLSEIE